MSVIAVSAREVVRHVLYKIGLYERVARRGGFEHLAAGDLKSRFSTIYKNGVWQHGDDSVPGSGTGSSLAATASLRRALPSLLAELETKTLLDVGCGDFAWMQHVESPASYIGVDVVDSVIRANAQSFERPGRRFLSLDATVDELPDADVVLCREVLFHLSFADIDKLLRNLVAKPRSYIIATSDRRTGFNADIPTGDFRLLNLEVGPFHFPPPVRVVDGSASSKQKIVGVWRADQLATLLR